MRTQASSFARPYVSLLTLIVPIKVHHCGLASCWLTRSSDDIRHKGVEHLRNSVTYLMVIAVCEMSQRCNMKYFLVPQLNTYLAVCRN